jgi:hypothetical protein
MLQQIQTNFFLGTQKKKNNTKIRIKTTVLLYTPGIKKYKGSGYVDFIFGPNSISKSK